MPGACIQAVAATPQKHGIDATVCTALEKGVETIVTTPRMAFSSMSDGPTPCALPYTTTQISVFALGGHCEFCPPPGEEFASAHFIGSYRFVEK